MRRGAFEQTDRGHARGCTAFGPGLVLAESLGGVESLIAPPATMTPAAMSAEARAAFGVDWDSTLAAAKQSDWLGLDPPRLEARLVPRILLGGLWSALKLDMRLAR